MIRFFRDGAVVATVDFSEPQLNLLAHAQAIELPTGSRCGGHGVCGGDRIRILNDASALSPVTSQERAHLSAEDLRGGIRLACQCFPNLPDLALDVEVL